MYLIARKVGEKIFYGFGFGLGTGLSFKITGPRSLNQEQNKNNSYIYNAQRNKSTQMCRETYR